MAKISLQENALHPSMRRRSLVNEKATSQFNPGFHTHSGEPVGSRLDAS